MHVPDSVVFLPGIDVVEIPIIVIDDTLTEGAEFFSFVIHNTFNKDTAKFWIHDAVPMLFGHQFSPPARIVCANLTNSSITAVLSGGDPPYSTIWYDNTGILSQSNILPSLPLLPYHRVVYMEAIDNTMCFPVLDSVKLYYFDSCRVTIHSSHPSPVPVGTQVTYMVTHDCPFSKSNFYWYVYPVMYPYLSNTNQMAFTWNIPGKQQVKLVVDHDCGLKTYIIWFDVVTGVEIINPLNNLQLQQLDRRAWQIHGENLHGKLMLRVMDMEGRVITSDWLLAEGGTLHHTIDLQYLAGGIYLLEIVSENGSKYREKIVCR